MDIIQIPWSTFYLIIPSVWKSSNATMYSDFDVAFWVEADADEKVMLLIKVVNLAKL